MEYTSFCSYKACIKVFQTYIINPETRATFSTKHRTKTNDKIQSIKLSPQKMELQFMQSWYRKSFKHTWSFFLNKLIKQKIIRTIYNEYIYMEEGPKIIARFLLIG